MSEKKTTTIPLTITFAGEMESLIRLIEASDSTGRAFALKRLREIAAWLDVNVELGNVDSKEEQRDNPASNTCLDCGQPLGSIHLAICGKQTYSLDINDTARRSSVLESDCKEDEATSAPVCAECKQEVGYLHWTTCRRGAAYHAGAEFVTELDCKEVE